VGDKLLALVKTDVLFRVCFQEIIIKLVLISPFYLYRLSIIDCSGKRGSPKISKAELILWDGM
jgi:hypothetical protein